MTDQEILEKIRTKYPGKYDNDNLLPSLDRLTPVIRKALMEFLETGEHAEIILFGYSVQRLIEDNKTNEVAAYLNLDYIIREPENALQSLEEKREVVHWSADK